MWDGLLPAAAIQWHYHTLLSCCRTGNTMDKVDWPCLWSQALAVTLLLISADFCVFRVPQRVLPECHHQIQKARPPPQPPHENKNSSLHCLQRHHDRELADQPVACMLHQPLNMEWYYLCLVRNVAHTHLSSFPRACRNKLSDYVVGQCILSLPKLSKLYTSLIVHQCQLIHHWTCCRLAVSAFSQPYFFWIAVFYCSLVALTPGRVFHLHCLFSQSVRCIFHLSQDRACRKQLQNYCTEHMFAYTYAGRLQRMSLCQN